MIIGSCYRAWVIFKVRLDDVLTHKTNFFTNLTIHPTEQTGGVSQSARLLGEKSEAPQPVHPLHLARQRPGRLAMLRAGLQ